MKYFFYKLYGLADTNGVNASRNVHFVAYKWRRVMVSALR